MLGARQRCLGGIHVTEESESANVSGLRVVNTLDRPVSACDKVHNARAILADLRTMGNALWPRFNGGKKGSLWYYRSLAKDFKRGGPEKLADELDRVVSEMERLAKKGP